MNKRRDLIAIVLLAISACGGGRASGAGGSTSSAGGSGSAGDGGGDGLPPAADYRPLDVGADYKSWTKMSKAPFLSKTHGGRYVEVYVNDIGLDAFKSDSAAFPVGTIIVKTSWETKDGKVTDIAGPIFVMEKKERGFSRKDEDWWFGLHWEKVPRQWQSRMKASSVYWQSPSQEVEYCGSCHRALDRGIGGVPADQRSW